MNIEKTERRTKQREVVLEELKKLTSHPTADELYEIVRRKLPNISLGTVYRNLEYLAEKRVIQKLSCGGPKTRFDGNPEKHCHVRCYACGKVEDAENRPCALAIDDISNLNGFKIIGYYLEFVGICPQCRKRQKEMENKGKYHTVSNKENCGQGNTDN